MDHDEDDGGDEAGNGKDSYFIGEPLQRLASSLGIKNARQFALRYGLTYSHINNVWSGVRPAGMQTIRKIARATGRAVAYFIGEEMGLRVVGSMDTNGRVKMDARDKTSGMILLPEACPPFVAGARLVMEPSVFRTDVWLVVRTLATGDEWIGWARDHAGMSLLVKPSGESIVYSAAVHEVVGAIVDVVSPPPPGPSA